MWKVGDKVTVAGRAGRVSARTPHFVYVVFDDEPGTEHFFSLGHPRLRRDDDRKDRPRP